MTPKKQINIKQPITTIDDILIDEEIRELLKITHDKAATTLALVVVTLNRDGEVMVGHAGIVGDFSATGLMEKAKMKLLSEEDC